MAKVFTPYKKDTFNQAVALRKRGFSYREIANMCEISLGTASKWLSAMPEAAQISAQNRNRAAKDNRARLLLMNKARSTALKKQYLEAERIAKVEYHNYRSNPLFMAGLALYVAEGDNTHPRLIRMANSRPELHRLFIRFTCQFLAVEKKSIRFWLILYPDLDEMKCVDYWSKLTRIPKDQFYKNQYIEGRSKKRTLHFGVGNTIIGSTLLKKKLDLWIKLALKEWK